MVPNARTLIKYKHFISTACFFFLAFAISYSQSIPIPKLNLGIDTAKTPDEVNTSLQLLALLTVLSVAPSIIILTTAFTRIVIVLSFVRQALGTQGVPPQQIVTGLSVILTFYVMAPTYTEINKVALKPYFEKKISLEQAYENLQTPLKRFMLKNTYQKDLNLLLNISGDSVDSRENVSIYTVIPAFILSELKTAFIIGFYIFIPLIIIDLVVASSMMSMGMMMMPPTVVALPVKILIFALADGWSMLVSSLLSGYF